MIIVVMNGKNELKKTTENDDSDDFFDFNSCIDILANI